MPERDTITSSSSPSTAETLRDELMSLGIVPGTRLLVHASLSSLGWVCGGPVAVIEALQHAVGPGGTLVMPSHTAELSEPSGWSNPPIPESWWPIVRASMPAFDPAISPTRGMGAIAELFRMLPNVVRSNHPHHSFAACGPDAIDITANHSLEDGLGEYSPLARLYERDAMVLLLGVGHERNTSLHLSEARGLGEEMLYIKTGAPVLVANERKWIEFSMPDYDSDDFSELGAEFAKAPGHVRSGQAGIGTALLMSQREIVDFGAQWIPKHRQNKTSG